MKKVVLLISMIFCVSLLVGCANMLDGLTTKVETNNVGIPVGEYKCVEVVKSNDSNPQIVSGGALISADKGKFTKGGFCSGLTLVFLEHGKIQISGSPSPRPNTTWEYNGSALYITDSNGKVNVRYKYVLV